MQDKIIFEEQDGSTKYSIVKGIFYISDLHSKHLAYRVMKHVRYEKPIYEFLWDKVSTSQAIYFEQKNERDHTCIVALKVHSRLGGAHDTP